MTLIKPAEFSEVGIKTWVVHTLGGGKYEINEKGQLVQQEFKVRLELTDKDLDFSISEAVEDYQQGCPNTRRKEISIEPGVQSYKLIEWGRGVIEVQLYTTSGLNYDPFYNPAYPVGFTDDLDNLEWATQHEKMARTILSCEFDWEFIAPYLYLANLPADASVCVYVYTDNYTDTNQIPVGHRKWIKERTLMYAKEQLIKVRGKFTEIPGPGGSFATDVADLRTETETLRTRLDTELQHMSQSFILKG